MSDEAGSTPILQIVKGDPTPEELAAVLAVLVMSAPPSDEHRVPASGWSAYWRSVKAPLTPGPGAWRSSAHPH